MRSTEWTTRAIADPIANAIEIFSRSRFPAPAERHVNRMEKPQFLHSSVRSSEWITSAIEIPNVNHTVRYPIPKNLLFPDCFIALGQPTPVRSKDCIRSTIEIP